MYTLSKKNYRYWVTIRFNLPHSTPNSSYETAIAYMHIIKTAKLKVENSVQTSFRFSPVSFSATRVDHRKLPRWRQAGVSKVNDGVRADVFRRNFVDAAVAVRRVAENRNPTVKR